ncbi:hypothetical protein ACFE33_02265 [Falsihalocynthiibacter sp. SS001]|uniref:hypothetical protein n=1 Tax=Falsihalocynthiibacter sp. SS001 TaxID=3349698 RepID=UPI0036D21850
MNELSLVKVRIRNGVWEGVLTSSGADIPQISVTHLEKPLVNVQLIDRPEEPNSWLLKVAIPMELISEGVHTFLIQNAESGETLNSFSLVTGDPLSQDIRVEMNLLREELDMLKRAFRRHCSET